LNPFLAALFAVSQLYHPRLHLTPCPNHPTARQTMAFAIPESMRSKALEEKTRGMEPDLCLAVTRRGGKAGELHRIYAVK